MSVHSRLPCLRECESRAACERLSEDMPEVTCPCRISRKLTDAQFDCLWALFLGSKGSGSNARTLESLRRRGLATVRRHQGEWLWEATPAGSAYIDNDPRSAFL